MAAPPPQGDTSEPETIAFGIAAVDAALDDSDLEFPADAAELLEAVGDQDIPYDTRGRTIPLSKALDEADRTHFETRRELLNALHPVFERKRGRGGIGEWLRSFVPF